ncbi:MAG: type II secretion system GspH family protein [Planctomycetales bacterium]|nr:type II secretion system GspH family protein [Planctomycetales bacterium]
MVRKVAAFTLVELLVVISIIVVLASIITPVAMTIGRKAKVVECGTHLGELAKAIHLYYDSVGKGKRYPPHDGAKFVACLYRTGTVKESRLFLCPAAPEDENDDGALLKGAEADPVNEGAISYAGRRNTPKSPVSIDNLIRREVPESRIAVFCDRIRSGGDQPTTNHGDTIVVSFLDGHVENLSVRNHLGGELRFGDGAKEPLNQMVND